MHLGVVISMYDEHDIVLGSINEIKSKFPDAIVSVIHSDDGTDASKIVEVSEIYTKLPDLSVEYDRFECPSRAVCRNFGFGFTSLYDYGKYDLIAAFTGDTKITDANNFQRMYDKMLSEGKYAMVSQAIGHDFHSNSADPKNDIVGGRFQSEEIHDFACTLFFIKGDVASKTKVFSNILVTNKFTSEQCFGDELGSKINWAFVGRLNASNPGYTYHYRDGISYHARSGRPGR